jgi:uncharacterized protein with PIN domain
MTFEALYTCEACNDMLTESEANTVTEAGYREIITLAFCPECWSG